MGLQSDKEHSLQSSIHACSHQTRAPSYMITSQIGCVDGYIDYTLIVPILFMLSLNKWKLRTQKLVEKVIIIHIYNVLVMNKKITTNLTVQQLREKTFQRLLWGFMWLSARGGKKPRTSESGNLKRERNGQKPSMVTYRKKKKEKTWKCWILL